MSPVARGPVGLRGFAVCAALMYATVKAAIAQVTPSLSLRYNQVRNGESAMLGVKDKVPTFSLEDENGQEVSLKDFKGKTVVLYFYPRADTPGCTREAIDFTRLESDFAENHTAILGVSADPLKAQEAFRDKHKLSVPLASDEHHRMLEAYGAWGEKSMYGRTFQGIIRTTVLIGTKGQILKVWRHVKVDGHAEEVLAVARAT